jgi:hypothetical protein
MNVNEHLWGPNVRTVYKRLLSYRSSAYSSPVMEFFLINAVDTLAISLFLFLLVNLRDYRRRRGLSYPPGPPSWPIIGNFLDIPKDKPWIAYTDMSKKYGRHIFGTTGSPQGSSTKQSKPCVSRRYHLSSLLFRGYRRVVFIFGH